MSDYLRKFLDKIGVNDYSQLTPEEKETYRAWETALSGRKLTDDEVKEFLAFELADTMDKITSQKHGSRTDIFLKMKLDMIRKISQFLAVPIMEKQMIESEIKSRIK